MQLAAVTAFKTRDFALLGKLLTKREPETAAKLIQLIPPRQTIPVDQKKVSADFITFCSLQNLIPEQYRGAVHKAERVEKKRLFIGIIIKLYGSHTRGIGKYLSTTLSQDQSLTRRMIKETEVRYRNYDEFRNSVDEMVEQIRKQ